MVCADGEEGCGEGGFGFGGALLVVLFLLLLLLLFLLFLGLFLVVVGGILGLLWGCASGGGHVDISDVYIYSCVFEGG